jgi:ubiquinone/menaquinone biosynthesis C-methylase UbiE
MRATNSAKDTLFAQLLPVKGKRVLEYGCGLGHNACLLAACGATVTAFDVSPVSIAKARRRAELLGLDENISFEVRAAGQTAFPTASFDLLVGSNILHHLWQNLDPIFKEIDRVLARNQAQAYFLEPMANSLLMRGLRRLLPRLDPEVSPDERQLYYRDLGPLNKYFTNVNIFHYRFLGRLDRFLERRQAEKLYWLDYQLQRICPLLRRCYGTAVIVARR